MDKHTPPVATAAIAQVVPSDIVIAGIFTCPVLAAPHEPANLRDRSRIEAHASVRRAERSTIDRELMSGAAAMLRRRIEKIVLRYCLAH
jgi:hypothetical protein